MALPCAVDGCARERDAKGYCPSHYGRWLRYGDPIAGGKLRIGVRQPPRPPRPPRQCDIDGCGRKHIAQGLCQTHYNRRQRGEEAWSRPIHAFTGRTVTRHGYVMVRVPASHPMATSYARNAGDLGRTHAYAMEHRVVMYEHLGRPLHPNENVHHVNGDKADNRLENLELWIRSQPSGQRVTDRVADALDILNRYAPHLLAV